MMRRIIMVLIFTCAGLGCLSSNAIADLIIADGKPTGQWYNPERNGEGFYVEVIDTGGNLQLGLAMFTYDEEGEQMWISGQLPIDSDDVAVTVPVRSQPGSPAAIRPCSRCVTTWDSKTGITPPLVSPISLELNASIRLLRMRTVYKRANGSRRVCACSLGRTASI